MMQIPLSLQLPKSGAHASQATLTPLKRVEVRLWIGGRKVGKQRVFINQVTSKKITTLFFPKTHIPRRFTLKEFIFTTQGTFTVLAIRLNVISGDGHLSKILRRKIQLR